jgi:hypothetical protein
VENLVRANPGALRRYLPAEVAEALKSFIARATLEREEKHEHASLEARWSTADRGRLPDYRLHEPAERAADAARSNYCATGRQGR